jgi:nucleoside phosphorylase
MVGIGGGAPNLPNHDIRLGDVVVSSPQNGDGGVLQYDHGAAMQNKPFKSKKHLNEPPGFLMSAVGELRLRYEEDEMPLQRIVNEALAKKPKLKANYQRPHPRTDRLYRFDYTHAGTKTDRCLDVCTDASALVDRPRRDQGPDDLMVHRGLIASGSALMKDATIRDRWAKERNVLCFEMEAAGLMNAFPCLVIRGICDYSDSHKNDEWQNFAAMMAAAYAKQIITVLPQWVVDEEDRITNRDIQGQYVFAQLVTSPTKPTCESRTQRERFRRQEKFR